MARTALLNNIHVGMNIDGSEGSYANPGKAGDGGWEWLIVEFVEVNSTRFVLVSDTNGGPSTVNGNEATAPATLREHLTMIGVFLRSDGESDIYLLVRDPVVTVPHAGTFFPVDGYVRLANPDGKLTLQASGRHAMFKGTQRDAPHPTAHQIETGFVEARSWHFDAQEKPWLG